MPGWHRLSGFVWGTVAAARHILALGILPMQIHGYPRYTKWPAPGILQVRIFKIGTIESAVIFQRYGQVKIADLSSLRKLIQVPDAAATVTIRVIFGIPVTP